MKETQSSNISPQSKIHLGFDIGSISVNAIMIDESKKVLQNRYVYCHGKPFHVLFKVIEEMISGINHNSIGKVAFTGSGGKQAALLTGGNFVNEIIAQ